MARGINDDEINGDRNKCRGINSDLFYKKRKKKASKDPEGPHLAFIFQFTWKYDILIISTIFEAMIKERTC